MKNYTIEEKITNTRNLRACKCYLPQCRHIIEKGKGYAIFIPSRGVRYLCETHKNNGALINYHGNAYTNDINKTLGSEKVTSLASTKIGVELETNAHNLTNHEINTLRAILENNFKCRAEYDCTVSAEFPTEKMQGLARLSKILQSLEKHDLLKALSADNVGAHIHAGCNKVLYVRRYYHSIFLNLANYIYSMSTEKRLAVFGSDFRGYAQMINEHSNATNHSNIFNTQHEHTLEFRLPRVRTYKQYLNVVKFWREIVCYINNYDFMENADANTRKERARACGNELVKIAQKYFY